MFRLKLTFFGLGLLLAYSSAVADDSPAVRLRKALAALERAHNAHDSAQDACSLRSRPLSEGPPRKGETLAINWSFIEKGTRELANREHKASEVFDVLRNLRIERRALFEDFLGCYSKQIGVGNLVVKSVLDAMVSLDDVADDLERELWNRVWALEKGNEAAKEHPELIRDPSKK